jgi:lysophospholipase L1-like esterase
MRNFFCHMRRLGLADFVVVLAATACGSSSSHLPGPPTPSAPGSAVWNIVALGDPDTTGSGDPTGIGWVGRYSRLLQQKLELKVNVTNIAVDGKTSGQLLSELRSDPTTRQDVAHAQWGSGGRT